MRVSRFKLTSRILLFFLVFSFVSLLAQEKAELFLQKPVNNALTRAVLDSGLLGQYTLKKYHFKNVIAGAEVHDTVYKYTSRRAHFYFNVSRNGEERLIYARIHSPRVPLSSPIYIGMPQQEFLDYFQLKNTDTVHMRDHARKLNYLFVFKNNTLKSLEINNNRDLFRGTKEH